jgi:hypothetical protein
MRMPSFGEHAMTSQPSMWRLFALVVLAGACGGFDTEEATQLCERDRQALESCFDDAVMQQCIACHEECGRDCSLISGATCSYTCD